MAARLWLLSLTLLFVSAAPPKCSRKERDTVLMDKVSQRTVSCTIPAVKLDSDSSAVGGVSAILKFSHLSVTAKCTYGGRASTSRRVLLLLLLLSGDVEFNLGPTYRFPCTVCCKAVRCNQMEIWCNECHLWTHVSCCGVNADEYLRLASLDDSSEWFCPNI